MKGKVALITGANSGIGFSCAEFLASRGARIYMVCRNKERGEVARQQIIKSSKNPDVHLLIGEVSMKQEVKMVAEDFMAKEKELNVLILNAGALSYKKEVNAEGVETTIAA